MTARKDADRTKTARAERLAEALRANLKRRKAQARGRAAMGGDAPSSDPGDSADDRRKPLEGGKIR
jgi:hypothetical protein